MRNQQNNSVRSTSLTGIVLRRHNGLTMGQTNPQLFGVVPKEKGLLSKKGIMIVTLALFYQLQK